MGDLRADQHWDLDEGDLRTVYDVETSCIVAEVDVDAGEAVGRLIVAAPKLLKSLKSVLASSLWKHNEGCNCGVCAEIRAVIEQAEGKQTTGDRT